MKTPLKSFFHANPRLSHRHRERWLFAFYAGIVALILLMTIGYLASLPFYYDYLQNSCYSSAHDCSLATMSSLSGEWRQSLGFTPSVFALSHIGLDLFFYSCYAIVAGLILLLKPKDAVGAITALTLVAFAFGDLVYKQWGGANVFVPISQSVAVAGFMCFALWFPSGRITRKWLGWTAFVAYLVRCLPGYLPFQAIKTDQWPLGLSLSWLILFYGTLAYSQLMQYRESTATNARQAIRKVAFGFIGAFLALICINLLLLVWPSLYQSNVFWLDLSIRLIMLFIPFSLGSALLKHKLWGVPPIVRRSFVYATLLVLVFGIYLATVSYLSLVFRSESGVFPLIATGVVAALFSPLKEGLEKLVNRMVYGKRENPVSFLVGLGDRLKEPYAPEQVLGTVASTVKEIMHLPHVSITILTNGREKEAAAAGSATESQAIRFPLVIGGKELGSLYVTTRSPDEPLTKADLKLLQLLGRESARIIQGLKQSLDISRLMQELQTSREQVIFAREEERRAIRNNLHDDLAPRLASLALSASAVHEFVHRDPLRATRIVSELEADIRVTVRDIREFVHNLRPPALDQYGLVEAIRQRAERLMYVKSTHGENEGDHIRIEVASTNELQLLPAAVEVAAYRIASEAMVNVIKHAKASTCRVTLTINEMQSQHAELLVEISDNGIGIAHVDRHNSGDSTDGVGLISIRERAEELGGRSQIECGEGGGTRIKAWLPLHMKLNGRAME